MKNISSVEVVKWNHTVIDVFLNSIQQSDSYVESKSLVFESEIAALEKLLLRKKAIVLDIENKSLDKNQFKILCMKIGEVLGEAVVQNEKNDKLIEVYDRRQGKIKDGVRYHQSREGGDIHTDSVNHPIPFKFLILGCYEKADVGGESIILYAQDVYKILMRFGELCDELKRDFWFEGRGMGMDVGLFKIPILSVVDGEPHFRYLRSYIESAHMKAGEPLTEKQIRSLDLLDTILENNQTRQNFLMDKMQILFTLDTQVFHGRTRFFELDNISKRMMYRVWVN